LGQREGAVANLVSNDAASALASGSIPKIRRALARLASSPCGRRAFRLAIVRTFTIETQTPALQLALRLQIGSAAVVTVADLNVIEGELFDPASATLRDTPDAVLVLWRLEELHPKLVALAGSWSAAERKREIETIATRFRSMVEGYLRIGTAPLVLSTLLAPAAPLSDATASFGLSWATAYLNALIFELASTSALVYVFDLNGWRQSAGANAFDEKMDFFARQPIARISLGSFSTAVARTLAPLVRPPAKVLAIDLDNVLWGGVLGEEGFGGISIGHEFPGNVYRQIQSHVRGLRDSGVLLALVSKNDPAPVSEAFVRRPEMILSLADFSAVRINWLSKHENLISISAELGLALESFVFVDDQPYERETVRFHLPAVKVLECGSDAFTIMRALRATPAFDALRVGEADRTRVLDYQAQRQRREAGATGSLKEFLKTLQLQMAVSPVDAASIDRAHQMLQKTNQFNVTTRRHSRAHLERMIQEGALALTLSMRDRFGDQGIVGLAIAMRVGEAADVDTFLMSCRALGRGAERVLWAAFVARLHAAGVRHVRATYDATAKNQQVADLFERFGMTLEAEFGHSRRYCARLPLAAAAPEWVSIPEAVVC
jgi:FkbH-like protein